MEIYFYEMQRDKKRYKSDKEIVQSVLLKLFYSGIGTGLILFILSSFR